MKSNIACSYCNTMVAIDIGEIVLKRRVVKQAKYKCPTCDSTTEVQIATKRVSKGKRMRAIETKLAEQCVAAIDARRAENAIAGAALLAEPGCECKPSPYYTPSTYNDRDTGHFLSTGWSHQDGFMLPTRPRHMHTCPLVRLA